MKTRSKVLLLTFCALVLVAASILGTVAYMTSQKKVTNTFTVGSVSIRLDEAIVDENGVAADLTVRTDDTNNTQSYHLIPGQTYTKDPTVTVEANSEQAYVRMMVTITNYTAVKAAFGNDFLPQNYVDGTWDSTLWVYTVTTEDTQNDTVTYEFRYFEPVTAGSSDTVLKPLFTQFTLPGTVTGEALANLANGFAIDVEGHAIQAATFADADAAWAAFDAQVNG